MTRCTRDGIRINTFMLDPTQHLRQFVEKLTELNRGRAFFTTPETLGDYVLVDFIEQRRSLVEGRPRRLTAASGRTRYWMWSTRQQVGVLDRSRAERRRRRRARRQPGRRRSGQSAGVLAIRTHVEPNLPSAACSAVGWSLWMTPVRPCSAANRASDRREVEVAVGDVERERRRARSRCDT